VPNALHGRHSSGGHRRGSSPRPRWRFRRTRGSGVALLLTCATASAIWLARASRASRWGLAHAAAAGTGALISRGTLAFLYQPLVGEVAAPAKYAHNVVMLVTVTAVGLYAVRQATDRAMPPPTPDRVGPALQSPSGGTAHSGRSPERSQAREAMTLSRLMTAVTAVIVVVFDPRAAIAREIPWPNVSFRDLPHPPAWTKWLWRAAVVAAIALAALGARARASAPEDAVPTNERPPVDQEGAIPNEASLTSAVDDVADRPQPADIEQRHPSSAPSLIRSDAAIKSRPA
jgi:hypothetical protein